MKPSKDLHDFPIKEISYYVKDIIDRFPFSFYMKPPYSKYHIIPSAVLRYLNPGDRLLDFGSGPCDITAVLQLIGFKCSAIDDLQDNWHIISDNKQKIIKFTHDMGIDFRVRNGDELPFNKNYFDMVILNDVIEHFHDSPRIILTNLLDLVRPKGYILISVPNAVNLMKRFKVLIGKTNYSQFNQYWSSDAWRGHNREYVYDDLATLAKNLNLEIKELRSCNTMLYGMPPYLQGLWKILTFLIPGGKDSWLLIAQKS